MSSRKFVYLIIGLQIYIIIFGIIRLVFFSAPKNPDYMLIVLLFIVGSLVFWFGCYSKSIYIRMGFYLWGGSMVVHSLGDIFQISHTIWFTLIMEILSVFILIMFFKGLKTLAKLNSPW